MRGFASLCLFPSVIHSGVFSGKKAGERVLGFVELARVAEASHRQSSARFRGVAVADGIISRISGALNRAGREEGKKEETETEEKSKAEVRNDIVSIQLSGVVTIGLTEVSRSDRTRPCRAERKDVEVEVAIAVAGGSQEFASKNH
ncbi:hypothetical protein ALC62_09624 [Cyphomyrmex costatus]|uniref:Uncharacterized protein n=1 Tax=Cyphomyrmex costatus TaxID=456900 RepID=A0A151IFE4_9HYME|nr:hypothetical protein ALC62_09624 [Cyphomyrmex costatus]